jgi:hypothetical protein
MSDDIVSKAVSNAINSEEREATGEVNGRAVYLHKTQYSRSQYSGPSAWKVAVYEGSDGGYPDEQEKGLSAAEADELFEGLVDKHGLSETE